MNQAQIIEKVSRSGQIFNVKFIKANGEVRSMTCKRSVLDPNQGMPTPKSKGFFQVFDVNLKKYRRFYPDTVFEVCGNGNVHKFPNARGRLVNG